MLDVRSGFFVDTRRDVTKRYSRKMGNRLNSTYPHFILDHLVSEVLNLLDSEGFAPNRRATLGHCEREPDMMSQGVYWHGVFQAHAALSLDSRRANCSFSEMLSLTR